MVNMYVVRAQTESSIGKCTGFVVDAHGLLTGRLDYKFISSVQGVHVQ